MLQQRLSIIAAVGDNRAIGRDNRLLWRIPEDMRRFRRTTMGHAVIMGSNTALSIGAPLGGRMNIVLSRNQETIPAGFLTATSRSNALSLCRDVAKVFFIGGAQVYEDALPSVNLLYLTEVHDSPADADAFFPEFDRKEWTEVSRDPHTGDGLRYDFVIYDRKP